MRSVRAREAGDTVVDLGSPLRVVEPSGDEGDAGRGGSADPLVEAFRRADLIDVSRGLVTAGVPRSTYGELRRRYPDTGFRRMLLRAFGRGLRADPLRPAPMLKF